MPPQPPQPCRAPGASRSAVDFAVTVCEPPTPWECGLQMMASGQSRPGERPSDFSDTAWHRLRIGCACSLLLWLPLSTRAGAGGGGWGLGVATARADEPLPVSPPPTNATLPADTAPLPGYVPTAESSFGSDPQMAPDGSGAEPPVVEEPAADQWLHDEPAPPDGVEPIEADLGDPGRFRQPGGQGPIPPTAVPPFTAPTAGVAADGTVSVLVPSVGQRGGPLATPQGGFPRGMQPPPAAPFPTSALPTAERVTPIQPAFSRAEALVAQALEPPRANGDGSQPGAPPDGVAWRPLPLLEALERSGDRSRRLWITQAYWKLAAATVRARFVAESAGRLELIAPGGGADEMVLLDLAAANARGEIASAGIELVAAQQELVDLVRLPLGEPVPWPVDRPLTSAYQTHFDTIFATRPATGRIRAINRQLPLESMAVEARAEAVLAAQQRFEFLEAQHAKGAKPIGAVLQANETLLEQQERLVVAVRSYNCDIAEYVMAVADLSVPEERFATMLIGRPIQWRAVTPVSGVVPVAGQTAGGQPLFGQFPGGGPVSGGGPAEVRLPLSPESLPFSPPGGPPQVFQRPAGLQPLVPGDQPGG